MKELWASLPDLKRQSEATQVYNEMKNSGEGSVMNLALSWEDITSEYGGDEMALVNILLCDEEEFLIGSLVKAIVDWTENPVDPTHQYFEVEGLISQYAPLLEYCSPLVWKVIKKLAHPKLGL
jgi:hypothetical protein